MIILMAKKEKNIQIISIQREKKDSRYKKMNIYTISTTGQNRNSSEQKKKNNCNETLEKMMTMI